MRFPFLRCALALAALLVVGATRPAQAQLYGLSSSTPGTVYRINTATGAATPVVDLAGPVTTDLVGLEFLGDTLYATDVLASSTFRFGTIDLTTGAFTPINNQGGSSNWYGLAADPAAGLFYSVDLDVVGFPLVSITPAGIITRIGPTNQEIIGLAFDSNHGLLYGVDNNELFTINTATGAATRVGALGINNNDYTGLAYDPVGDVLYLNTGGGDNSLYRVNRSTGAVTLVGPNGTVAGYGIDGLTFRVTPQPEPATLIRELSAYVSGLSIHHGTKNSFVVKLEAALSALEAGDAASACAKLQDFINHARAQRGKKLTVAQAQALIGQATAIRIELGCS